MCSYAYIRIDELMKMLELLNNICRATLINEILKNRYCGRAGTIQYYFDWLQECYRFWCLSGISDRYRSAESRQHNRTVYYRTPDQNLRLDYDQYRLSCMSQEYYRRLGFEHDDRTNFPHEVTRRVSFKSHNGGRRIKNNRQRGWDNKLRAILQDEDVEMHSNVNRNFDRYNVGGSRKPNRAFHKMDRINNKRTLNESPSYWYKVTIRYAARYEKDYLLKMLGNYIKPAPFIPIGYKIVGSDVTFAIEDHAAAEELLNAHRRITVTDGFRLSVQVRSYNPIVEVNTRLTEVMTKVMSSRYNMYNKALDLSKFHLDPNFLAENLCCPLNRENVMLSVIGIINDSIPDLVALDLSNNKLNTLSFMKSMVDKLPSLKVLHLGKNKLRDVKQLDPIRGLNLEELVLDANMLCDKFTERDEYIRAVRLRFPKVLKLDYVDLPPPILFDVGDDDAKLPPSQASFMCDADRGATVVRAFLEQYYQIYDSDNRSSLAQAYHESAQFSLDCYLFPMGAQSSSFSSYLQESRNLFRMNHNDRRIKLLKIGKTKIVETLRNLPKTQHDPTSFVVDLVLFTPTLIQLNVCGLFKESDKPNGPMKFFSRVFIIVPVGTGGFCIVNEQVTIMMATQDQIKKVTKLKEAAAATAAVAVAAPSNPAPTVELDLTTKQQMVTTLSMKTGMNLGWSEKCLTETNWNFEQATNAFLQLQKAGSIPAEAFQK